MPFLIALAGLSGAGKTTAVDHFTSLNLGQKVYLGEIVLNEIRERGLPCTPDNERAIRLDLRKKHGPGVMLRRAAPIITQLLDDGINLFLDAIFEIEEYRELQTCCGNVSPILLAIEATFEVRSRRLRSRPQRPLTPEDLKKRDDTEITKLATNSAIAQATHTIRNEGTLQSFHSELDQFLTIAVAGTPLK